MKYLKYFEGIESRSYSNDKELIKKMEDSITAIFVELLDDGYDIYYQLTDYAGNIGLINFKLGSNTRFSDAKPFEDCLDMFRTLQEYLRSEGYDFYYINLRGWIENENDYYKRCQSFQGKDWQYVEDRLLTAMEGARDNNLYSIGINVIKI